MSLVTVRMRRSMLVAIAVSAVLAMLTTPAIGSVSHWQWLWHDIAYGDVDYYVASDGPAPFNTATARSELANGRLTWNNVNNPPELID